MGVSDWIERIIIAAVARTIITTRINPAMCTAGGSPLGPPQLLACYRFRQLEIERLSGPCS